MIFYPRTAPGFLPIYREAGIQNAGENILCVV